jgi:hypothetical protein
MSGLVDSQGFAPRRRQAIASLGLLAVLVATCLMTDLLARNRSLDKLLRSFSSEFAKKNNTLFQNTGNFIDFEDRFLLDEIPRTDYSLGGIYFFGSSNMKWAFTTWDLPEKEKRFVGNYGIGASSHTDQLRLIRYLIEERGFLSADERDLVIFGVAFQDGRYDPPTGYFTSLLLRHGLFTVMPDGRIASAPMTRVERALRVEKARSGGFFWNVGRVVKAWMTALVRSPSQPLRGVGSFDNYLGFMGGSKWQQNMDVELEALRETIILLRHHKAQVKVMLVPQPTWDDQLPYKPHYEAKIRALCEATSTPLIDLSRAMADEDFVDSSHLTVDGQQKFRGLIWREISGHLAKLNNAYTLDRIAK